MQSCFLQLQKHNGHTNFSHLLLGKAEIALTSSQVRTNLKSSSCNKSGMKLSSVQQGFQCHAHIFKALVVFDQLVFQ